MHKIISKQVVWTGRLKTWIIGTKASGLLKLKSLYLVQIVPSVCGSNLVTRTKTKCVLPTAKHGGWEGHVLGLLCALPKMMDNNSIEGTINANRMIQRMIPSIWKLGHKSTSKMTSALLKKLRLKVMEWPSMSPDLNYFKHLYKVDTNKVSSIHHLHNVVMEELKRPNSVMTVLGNNGSKATLDIFGPRLKMYYWKGSAET